MLHAHRVHASFLLAVTLAACSTNPGTSPTGTGQLQLQLATTGTGATAQTPGVADGTVDRGTDVLVVSRVELVARHIKLKRVSGSCPAPDLSDAGTSDTADSPDCPNLKLGPLLLDPPIAAGVTSAFSLSLPAGQYSELQLQIHKPTNHNSDAAFLAANPDFAGVSIKVTGQFNGLPFTFTTDLTAALEVVFDSPVDVMTAGTTSLTLLLDVRGWFLDPSGQALLSPLALSQQTRSQVEHNIRLSFHGFRDNDHDGKAD